MARSGRKRPPQLNHRKGHTQKMEQVATESFWKASSIAVCVCVCVCVCVIVSTQGFKKDNKELKLSPYAFSKKHLRSSWAQRKGDRGKVVAV